MKRKIFFKILMVLIGLSFLAIGSIWTPAWVPIAGSHGLAYKVSGVIVVLSSGIFNSKRYLRILLTFIGGIVFFLAIVNVRPQNHAGNEYFVWALMGLLMFIWSGVDTSKSRVGAENINKSVARGIS
jgi:hypothetical protein